MAFDKPITIQFLDDSQDWVDRWHLHASVNYSQGNEYADSGAQRSVQTLNFRVRYFSELKEISRNTQGFRIVFEGDDFNIQEYDDFMLQHKEVRLQGVSYGT